VTFTLHTHQLGYYDEALRYMVQPGVIEVMVGNASTQLPLGGQFRIVGQRTEVSACKVFFSEVQETTLSGIQQGEV
jgi:beta-glucosidase